ncbi:hypothetical protein [Planomicrobium sp. YIM 101495]|uniref:hypothetical protein n=1 Tax=Planomicrobium sp. YIM 101495 TaxID=2665160 RepID=UPI0012B70764|nr:hypothetical protein [Planomicrobium sp. YIM 101495]MTD30119.1 hypothetical protein [Planomicrobium sp. YIM 101495]
MKQLSDKDFFFCYKKSMSCYLRDQGFHYIFKAKSIKNGETFTLYQKSSQLQQALDEYGA